MGGDRQQAGGGGCRWSHFVRGSHKRQGNIVAYSQPEGGKHGKIEVGPHPPPPPSCARTGRLPRLTDGAERGGGGTFLC